MSIAIENLRRLLTDLAKSSDIASLQNILSTRASETTLASIRSKIDLLTFDTANRLAIQNPPNLDVALSTRASESTLSSILSQLDVKLSTRASESTLTAIKSKTDNIDVALSTRASESTLSGFSSKFPSAVALSDSLSNPTTTIIGCANLGWDGANWRRIAVDSSNRLRVSADVVANPPNLDVSLTVLARLQRFGRDVTPMWYHGSIVTAPSAGTTLVSRTVPSGRQGFIYGFFISASEANDFNINWTSGTNYSIRIIFPSAGSLHFTDFIALNEGLPANGGTTISITNLNAGSSNSVYQARLLIAEV